MPCSGWLFPEIAEEKREERIANSREAAQRVRQEKRKAVEYLRGRDLQWLIDKLVDDGPAHEVEILFSRMDGELLDGAMALMDLWALWRIGKLWRKSAGIHPGSGEETHLYGIRGVHTYQKWQEAQMVAAIEAECDAAVARGEMIKVAPGRYRDIQNVPSVPPERSAPDA